MELTSLPGFRDFFPEEMAHREYIFSKWKEIAFRYGFLPYDGPPLELTDLYRRKSGDEIVEQLYCFEDKGGRDISLRPEMTPSLARMVASRGQSIPRPMKWFSIPQLFRYERQQRGRLREHFQFNCDILGEESVAADVELVALVVDCLRAFGLTHEDFRVRVSDRQLLTSLMKEIGIHDEKQLKIVFAAVDKLAREPVEKTKAKMSEGGLKDVQVEKLLSLFHQKSLVDIANQYRASSEVNAHVTRLQDFFKLLDAIGLNAFVEFDLSIVRGLAYYTGVVFEAFDRKGEFRAICGGGRYDHLVKTIGAVDIPALGFGMGDVVLGELLTARKLWPVKSPQSVDVYLVLIDESLRPFLLSTAHQLREAGIKVDYSLIESAVGRQFKAASQKGACVAVIFGPEEWKLGIVKLKNLETRQEVEIKTDQLQIHLLETLRQI